MSEEFKKAFEQHYTLLMRILYHITGSSDTSEDVIQETFIKLYNHKKEFESEDHKKMWLIRVAKNLAYNHEKRLQRERKAYEKELYVQNENTKNENEEKLLKEELENEIQKNLLKIPYKLRIALTLREYGNLNYKQIAKVLKTSESNVKVRIFRARKTLHSLINLGDFYE